MLFWHVPAPNEALLISGSKRLGQDTQFRIVTGHGSFVLPIKQKARVLSLALREAEIAEDCVTQQGIRLTVRAVTVFKVGDDFVSIANAARRFLAEQQRMEELVGRIFAGHLRSIIGGLTVEQIIRERDRVAQEVKAGSHNEMEKLGIVVDALQIQEIEDATGYITNLAAPHAAAVASRARIAQAKADQEASEREQEALALKAEYERDTAIKRAGFVAETEQANARAAQSGPLAQAKASQEVIEEQTALARRQAELAAQRLEAEVRRPADAEAYRQRALSEARRDMAKFEAEGEAYRRTTLATAEAQAVRVQADGDAYAERTTAEAQAAANAARAESLRGGAQELIAANRVVENLPALVDAAARGISGSNLTILNGSEGVSQVAAGIVGQGLAILDVLKQSTTRQPEGGADGSVDGGPVAEPGRGLVERRGSAVDGGTDGEVDGEVDGGADGGAPGRRPS
ncbi:SPFH domain-containing protein [Kitasatospora sp. NBC_01287]|uniref:SPFH domain-containing protein n=1 Tax=Kitasatospora sp. NBC_01287 TaxID=2903573 RepID=UPI002253F3C4|nr:flotillin family protein [Kitasatospora sp. NBC_01287]MCX4750249.1 SPFH domain-containing protein [Kitasatospora sp. NBC_01287]